MQKRKLSLDIEGIFVYEIKNNLYEIFINGTAKKTKSGESEFKEIEIFRNGIRVRSSNGKYLALLFKTKDWFEKDGIQEFNKLFIFGEIAASISGELLNNYAY